MFEELHGGGIGEDKIRVVIVGKNPAASLRVDGLNGQPDALNRCWLVRTPVKIDEIL